MIELNSKTGEEQVIATACASHCGGRCLLKVHVRDGVITRIETDDGDEPQLRACLRCRAYRQRVYAPNRIRFPMRRVGERGEGKFEQISWDEALDTIVGELGRIKDTCGPSAILLSTGGGDTMRLHTSGLFVGLFSLAGGFTGQWGSASWEGALYAEMATYGTICASNDFDDIINSRLIILWGCNPAVTIHETPSFKYLIQAKESGCRIITVDPKYTDSTAILTDHWIPIIPGTDAAMMIAMAYVIVIENLHDHAFLDAHTVGFEAFKDYLMGVDDGIQKTPVWAESITGVRAEVIESLAREYATAKPAALIAGIGPGRTASGEQYHRAAHVLAAMTGNIGIHGGWGGRSYATPRFGGHEFKLGNSPHGPANPVESNAPLRQYSLPTLPGTNNSARIHITRIADAILKGKAGGYPADIKMAFVIHTNPLNQFANTGKVAKAFKKLEFVAVAEQVMTATAMFSDILLPVSTFMERNDIVAGGASPFYGNVRKVIEPLYKSKSPLDICRELAIRMGFPEYINKNDEELVKEMVSGSDIPDYDNFKETAVYRLNFPESRVAFKNQVEDIKHNPFPTPSGKIEIYSESLAAMNNSDIPPIPKYIEQWESRNDPLSVKYPLQLITTHFKRRAHSQYENLPWLTEIVPQALSINSFDAKARGINNGDQVRVFNDRGEVIVPALVTERIMPGVVDLPEGAWYRPDEYGVDRGGCANVLTNDCPSPGGAFCFNTNLVQVEKYSTLV